MRIVLIRDTSNKDGEFTLAEPLTVYLGPDIPFTIPAGSTTDFASVPYGLRWLVNRRGTDVAGLVHDYLYRTKRVRRQIADGVLYSLCRDEGVGRTRSLIIFLAVFMFGHRFYGRSGKKPEIPSEAVEKADENASQ